MKADWYSDQQNNYKTSIKLIDKINQRKDIEA